MLSVPARFARGFGCLFRALAMVLSDRRKLLLALVPFLICLVLYMGFFAAAVLLVDEVTGLIIEPGTWWRTVLRVLLMIALPLAFFLVLVFTYTMVCLVVGAPFFEALSAGVEQEVTGEVLEQPFSLRGVVRDIWRALRWTLLILCLQLGVCVFGLLFVPVTSVIAFAVSAVLVGLEHLDPAMERRRLRLGAKLAFARRRFWELLGFGLPLLLGMAVPLVGALVVPFGVAGGTLLFVQIRGEADGGLPELEVADAR